MKKLNFNDKSKAELMDALSKEQAVVRAYTSAVASKGSLKDYKAGRKNIARIQTALSAVDKK